MLNNSHFSYLWFFRSKGENHTKWERKHVAQIPELLEEFGDKWNCYATIQQYSKPNESDGEMQIAPLFFDLDVHEDKDGKIDLTAAIEDSRKIIQFFSDLKIEEHNIRIWFSGRKGFHITIAPECMGIRKHPYLTYIIRLAADYIAEYLDLQAYDDSVYSIKRLWRCPNTIHTKTGKYCVELYHQDLNLGAEAIKELASEKREPLYEKEEYANIIPSEVACDWFSKFMEIYDNQADIKKLASNNALEKDIAGLPVCVKDVNACGLKKAGTRNSTCLALATYYKDAGYPEDKATSEIIDWVSALPESLTKTPLRARIANTKSTVKSVYEGANYHFSCAYMRSLGVGADTPMACEREKCKFVKAENQEVKNVLDLDLYESRKSCFANKKIRFSAFVSGEDSVPFWVPQHVEVKCKPNMKEGSVCHRCALKDNHGTSEISFSAKSGIYISMTKSSASARNTMIRKHAGIPEGCKSNRIKILNEINVQRITLTPEVGFETAFDGDTKKFKSIRSTAFVLGQELDSNYNYEFIGYSMADPKTSYCVQIVESATRKTMEIDNFEIGKTQTDDLAVFEGEPKAKFEEIHEDLEQNVHHVWGRRDMAIGMDLIYHSPISFKFQNDWIQRGWVQGIFVGDTGQAKSMLAKKLLQHYNCGNFINCETASRTGILYNLVKNMDTDWNINWGDFVTADRMLMILDELQQIEPEVLQELGGAREEGFIKVSRVEKGSAYCRVRLAMIANPRGGSRVDSMNFGVESIKRMFSAPKDIRRCDFGMILASNQVDHRLINKKHESTVPAIYTSDRCSNLIKWIWSRRPEQIVFTPGATNYILEKANFFSEKYACNIPLCEPGDMRIKLCRMSAASAGRTRSTKDKDSILIREAHVDQISEYLQGIYDDPVMGFDRYAKIDQTKNILDDHRRHIVGPRIRQCKDWPLLIEVLLESITFNSASICEMWADDRDEVRALLSIFRRYRFIEQNKFSKYYKTPAFNMLLKEIIAQAEKDGVESFSGGKKDEDPLPEWAPPEF